MGVMSATMALAAIRPLPGAVPLLSAGVRRSRVPAPNEECHR